MKDESKWFSVVQNFVRMLPWIVAAVSGSAGGAVTVAALQTAPLSVNEIIKTETRVLFAIENHTQELERIYGILRALDQRQREIHTDLNTLKVVTSLLQENHNATN